MSLYPPPLTEEIADDDGVATLAWVNFFNQSFIGDTGNTWVPNFVSLTTAGTPTISGRYYKLGQELCFFHIHIIPGTSTSATAGTTYVDNFPLTVSRNGVCASVAGDLGGALGVVQESTNRVYVPSWSSVTVPLTILGFVEAR